MKSASHFAPGLRTRRSILRWGGAGAVAAAAAAFGWKRAQKAGLAGSPPPRPQGPRRPASPEAQPVAAVKPMSRESFMPHLGSEFRLESDPHTTTICKLVEISAATALRSRTTAFTSFALLFAVPGGFPAESKVYVLTHEQLGAMRIFLSPVGKSGRQLHLEAVFTQAV